jgi:hypothetical protein
MKEDTHTQTTPQKVVKPFINATIVAQITNSKISARSDFDAGWSSPRDFVKNLANKTPGCAL